MKAIASWLAPIVAAALAVAPATAIAKGTAVTLVEPGVHRIGSADAELMLTEYVSYTCSHCADFETEAGDVLKLVYVPGGRVSVEIRHAIRDAADLTATMLANCGAPDRFPANHAAIMRAQGQWLGRLQNATEAQRVRYKAPRLSVRMQAMGRDSGLYALMTARGYSAADLDRCLADEKLANALAAKSQAYWHSGLTGTPSFAIGGVLLAGTHDWDSLKMQLDARLKR